MKLFYLELKHEPLRIVHRLDLSLFIVKWIALGWSFMKYAWTTDGYEMIVKQYTLKCHWKKQLCLKSVEYISLQICIQYS